MIYNILCFFSIIHLHIFSLKKLSRVSESASHSYKIISWQRFTTNKTAVLFAKYTSRVECFPSDPARLTWAIDWLHTATICNLKHENYFLQAVLKLAHNWFRIFFFKTHVEKSIDFLINKWSCLFVFRCLVAVRREWWSTHSFF